MSSLLFHQNAVQNAVQSSSSGRRKRCVRLPIWWGGGFAAAAAAGTGAGIRGCGMEVGGGGCAIGHHYPNIVCT